VSLTSRLLGLSGTRAATTPVARATPTVASQGITYSTPNMPMTSEWDAGSAVGVGYYGHIYHYRCIRTIATTIAGLPFRAGKNPLSTGVFDANAPLARLLGPLPGSPAPSITPRQLWVWSIVSYLATGRWGWETAMPPGSKTPASLWPLVAANLYPITSQRPGEWFSGFEYQTNAQRRTMTLDQVMYAWRPSQKDWRQPESAMQAMALPTQIGVALDRFMVSFMRNNMVGSKLVLTPGFDDDSMRRNFQDQFLAEMTGVDNAGQTAFAEWEDEGGENKTPSIQVVDLGTKPVDAQVIQLQNWVRDTICNGWGVPVSIVGQSAERTYANADQEHKNYWTGAVLEIVNEIQDLVNTLLAPRLGDEVGWFDLSGVEALKPTQRFTPIAADVAVTKGIATVGEVREEMALPPQLPTDPNAPPAPTPIPSVDDTPGTEGGPATGSNPRSRAATVEDRAAHVHDFRAGICTGPGPCDTSPLGEGDNWLKKVNGLPPYIRAIAHSLRRRGMSESEAIATAIATVKRWAAGGGHVTAKTKATASAAVAEWESKKAASHARADLVTETSPTGAALLPVAGKPMLIAHRPVRSKVRGKCALCDKPISHPLHMAAMGRKRGRRHAGPGHAHVPSGHHSTARRRVVAQVDAHATAMEPAITKAMRSVFAAQRKATVDRLNGNRGKSMLRAAQEPPPDDKQPAPLVDASQVFDFAHWVGKTRDALEPFYAAVAATPQPRLASFPGTTATQQAIEAALRARSGHLAETVSRTTLDQITAAISQAIAQGDSIGEMTKAVNAVFDTAGTTRAEMISRTEALGAINAAGDAHAAALGPSVVAGKEWAAAHDDRVRPTHREADGQVRAFDVPFTVGGFPMSGPGDPTAPADEVIACRCTSLYLTPAEYAKRSGVHLPSISPPIAA
jgi:HK97 family phage portal protein